VGLGLVDIFALGAAIGKSQSDNTARATGWLGILIDIKGCHAVIHRGMDAFGGKRMVIGQGISLSMMVRSISFVIYAYSSICSFLAT
jgi:hypothetical protein